MNSESENLSLKKRSQLDQGADGASAFLTLSFIGEVSENVAEAWSAEGWSAGQEMASARSLGDSMLRRRVTVEILRVMI